MLDANQEKLFCHIYKTLKVSPAIAAGLSDTLRDVEWIVSLIYAPAPKPGLRGPYKSGPYKKINPLTSA